MRVKKNLNVEKIAFKVDQMKSLELHITNPKLRFYIYTGILNVQNNFMEHDLYLILMIFVMKENIIILTLTMCCWLIYLCYLRNVFVVPGLYLYILYFAHDGHVNFYRSEGKQLKSNPLLTYAFLKDSTVCLICLTLYESI